MKLDSFMCKDNFEEDVDFLFQGRKRLGSDTCFSSSNQMMSSEEEGAGYQELLSVDPSTFPQEADIDTASIDFRLVPDSEQSSDKKDILSLCDQPPS